jgi:hypothetical protein
MNTGPRKRIAGDGRAYAGSQRQIQMYVNQRSTELNLAVADALGLSAALAASIRWVSPLANDRYLEYRDAAFLRKVGLERAIADLGEFWPSRGPCWDALATTMDGCILVEAKSHVSEMYSGGCVASPTSLIKIQRALTMTKNWMGISPAMDWLGPLYQSANRFAFLYFLRQIVGVEARLVNIYFENDARTPTSKAEWLSALEVTKKTLGLTRLPAGAVDVILTALG